MNASADSAKPLRERVPPRRRSALSLVIDDSGGIVRFAGVNPGFGGGAAFGLRLAALEVFAQRRGQAPPALRGLFTGLRAIVHRRRIGPGAQLAKPSQPTRETRLACAPCRLVARNAALADMRAPCLLAAQRCRSSVVEHSLGKGEVVSSILPGSTIYPCIFRSILNTVSFPPIVERTVVLGVALRQSQHWNSLPIDAQSKEQVKILG